MLELICQNMFYQQLNHPYVKYYNSLELFSNIPDSKVHGSNMGPIWGRQDPGGPHVGPMNFAIWEYSYGNIAFYTVIIAKIWGGIFIILRDFYHFATKIVEGLMCVYMRIYYIQDGGASPKLNLWTICKYLIYLMTVRAYCDENDVWSMVLVYTYNE